MRTTKRHGHPKSDGARCLREWLIRSKLSVPKFCEIHNLDRIAVQRAMNGERIRISVDLAYLIEQATEGDVPWHAWRSETRRSEGQATGTDGR